MLLASGIFKLACAAVSGWVRELVPRAGLLGSLAAIALAIISFLPLLDIAAQPVAGFVALAVILATLTARWRLPAQIPGALGGRALSAVWSTTGCTWLGLGRGWAPRERRPSSLLRLALPAPRRAWWDWFQAVLARGPQLLAGGDPAGAGDGRRRHRLHRERRGGRRRLPDRPDHRRRGLGHAGRRALRRRDPVDPVHRPSRLQGDGGARRLHPGDRPLRGAAGIFGYFDWIFFLIPKAVIFPILIFIGLEITAQSFHATPARHYPAVALACVPALAYLALITLNQVLPEMGKPFAELRPRHPAMDRHRHDPRRAAFIVTSLLWGTCLTHLIDGRVKPAAATLALAARLRLVRHHPLAAAVGPDQLPAAVLRQLSGRAAATRRPPSRLPITGRPPTPRWPVTVLVARASSAIGP